MRSLRRLRMIPRRLSNMAQILLLCASAVCAGCATSTGGRAERENVPTLIVSRAESQAILSWPSNPNERYTVLYAEGRKVGAEWRPLPGASNIRGTGGVIEYTDEIVPGTLRHYRLMVMPAEKRRR